MFEKNLVNYTKNNDLGKCPNCGGIVELIKMKVPHRVNLIIRCLSCKKEEMFTGTYQEKE